VAHASPITTEAIARIGALYAIEEEIRGKPAELRKRDVLAVLIGVAVL
jgi:hypothetical protein